MAVTADKEDVGVLVVRLLWVGNGEVGDVEAGSLEELTVNRGSLSQPQPQKIFFLGVLFLAAGILGGIVVSFLSVWRLSFCLCKLRRLRGDSRVRDIFVSVDNGR